MTPLDKPLGVDQCNCFAMRKAARQITRFYDARLEPAGLRVTQYLTLAALREAGSVAVNALAEHLDIERTAMGKMLGFLERDGLIRIRPSPTDGRSRLVELTEDGRRRHAQASPLWREAQRQSLHPPHKGALDMRVACTHHFRMSTMIQIRNVPDDLHRKMKARAALEGKSLSEYLLAELRRLAELPTPEEWRARLATREPVSPPIDAAEAVRAERDSR